MNCLDTIATSQTTPKLGGMKQPCIGLSDPMDQNSYRTQRVSFHNVWDPSLGDSGAGLNDHGLKRS